MMEEGRKRIDWRRDRVIEQCDAYLFDLDGVITPTVLLHRRAWREVFEPLFVAHGVAPYRELDYFESLDGRPRFAGVAQLLGTRHIELPVGEEDEVGTDSIRGLGNLKNQAFADVLAREGIEPYPGSRLLINQLGQAGKPLAIVSSSRNAEAVLQAAGMRDHFSAVVDGVSALESGLPGKPAPDTFVHAAQLLGVTPDRAVVFEDAASGVVAGRAGGFGLVVGVDRGAGREPLLQAGAHIVVADLEELL